MLREGHKKRLPSASLFCVPGSVWASKVPPGSPRDCNLELTSELSPEQRMCLSIGRNRWARKGRATKQSAVPSSQTRLFLLVSQEITMSPGKAGIQEEGDQTGLPGIAHLEWGRAYALCSYPLSAFNQTIGKGGSVHSRTGHIMGRTQKGFP